MFCEKCGTQIPDGGDTLCPRCRAAETPVQPVQPQFQQPAQPQYQQPMMQQPMANAGGLNGILANPMLVMLIKLVFGAISLWAAFGPLLKYIDMRITTFSFMDMNKLSSMFGSSSELTGYFVPLLILMILAIILALAGIALTILPKVAPQVKLPIPSCSSYAATVFSLLCAIIGEFITIGFVGTSKGAAALSGFGVFMMILSFLAIAGSVFLAYVELKKK